MKDTMILLVCLLLLAGCSTTPHEPRLQGYEPIFHEDFWGPGVKDPDAMRDKLLALIDLESDYAVSYIGRDMKALMIGMASSMTWEQAAYVYRTAPIKLKRVLVYDLLSGKDRYFRGMNRAQVVRLIGQPDKAGEGNHGLDLLYTGEGFVSDSMFAAILVFDRDGKFERIVYAP